MYDILSLGEMLLPDLRNIADEHDIAHKGLKKQDLAYKILDYQAVNPEKFKGVKSSSDNKPKEQTEAKPPRVKKAAPIRKPKEERTTETAKDAPKEEKKEAKKEEKPAEKPNETKSSDLSKEEKKEDKKD